LVLALALSLRLESLLTSLSFITSATVVLFLTDVCCLFLSRIAYVETSWWFFMKFREEMDYKPEKKLIKFGRLGLGLRVAVRFRAVDSPVVDWREM